MTVVSLAQEKFRREQFTIILADEINQAVLNHEPLDTDPLAPFLLEIAEEIRAECKNQEDAEWRYRQAVAGLSVPRGEIIDFNIDLKPYHETALTWACGYLAEVENALGIRLLERGRA